MGVLHYMQQDVSAELRSRAITLTVRAPLLRAVEQARGREPRASWVRRAIEAALRREAAQAAAESERAR